MRKYLLLSLVSVLSLSASDVCARDEAPTTSCETLGYNTPYDDCVRENGMPLVCPFYSLDKKMVLCMKESCRGYSLTDADLDALASDGKKVRDHIASTEECTVGFGEDAKTYYRVKECKSGSLYQNGICDVGCLQARYPYDKHPGDLPGDVEMCVDTAGKWYGYNDCNAGWVGGWQNNQTGYCEFATCSIQDYPYTYDPNINSVGEDVNRGATLTCKIGSNTYYRYTAVDKEGNQLTSNVCGISNNYTLSRGACRKQCVFDNCTNAVKTETLSGYTFSYNEFTCTQKTQDCRVGDVAVFNGVEAGVIVHLPTDNSDKLRISAITKKSGAYTIGNRKSENLPLPDVYTDNGKYNSKFILKFIEQNNATLTEDKYIFPVFEDIVNYFPTGCDNIPVCKAGEWYIPSHKENVFIFESRYLLYNAMNNTSFKSGYLLSSDEYSNLTYPVVYLSGTNWVGEVYGIENKDVSSAKYYPMLSFYVR